MAAVRHLGYSSDAYWTTHEEYLVVFMVVQNEHGWIRCSFDNTIVNSLRFWLGYAYLRLQIRALGAFDHL